MATLKSLFNALVVNKQEYSAVIWYSIYDTHIQTIERVFKVSFIHRSYPECGINCELLNATKIMYKLYYKLYLLMGNKTT